MRIGSATPSIEWVRSPTFAVAAIVTLLGLLPFVVGGADMPLGPDAPVYIWWYRLTGLEGLAAVSKRPGALGLALASRGPLSPNPASSLIALEVGAAVAIAVAVAILASRSGVRSWVGRTVAGGIAGVMALGLSAGWISNAAFAVCYFAAVVLLTREGSRGWFGPGVALGAAALCHPLFFALGGTVLLVVGGIEWFRGDRSNAWQIGLSLGLGALLGGAALAAASMGSTWSGQPTSGDALFRAAGLTPLLAERYREGFLAQWGGGLWLALPIVLLLLGLARGRAGRIAAVWVAVSILAIPFFLMTGIAPAARLPRWALPLPIFLALAGERIWRGDLPPIVRRVLGALAVLVAVGLLIGAASLRPSFTTDERAAIVGAWSRPPPSSAPIVASVAFEPIQPANRVMEVWNELRAMLPPEVTHRVFVFYGEPGDLEEGRPIRQGDGLDEALSETTLRWIREHGGEPWAVRPSAGDGQAQASTSGDLLQPSSRGASVLWVVTLLGAWIVAGWPWSRTGSEADGWAEALLVGAVMLTWAAFLLDRAGMSLHGMVMGSACLAVATGLSWAVGRLDARIQWPPER